MPKRSTSESIVSQHSLIARREAFLRDSPWVLRLTVHKGKPAPVMIVKSGCQLPTQLMARRKRVQQG